MKLINRRVINARRIERCGYRGGSTSCDGGGSTLVSWDTGDPIEIALLARVHVWNN